ncbi:chromosome segregation protein SMC [Bhargavaea beijingensis]|uniref:Chromosome partition protein Smc n=1 Tax=Bhargavaea beijingensis TaxID=426756 RepID=A0ABX9ZG67_9BACL|nr:chromosome segregation protein SMC [Bhargavaea beijingensis]RSK36848.1 chromosome segregation protein SMC [Bhargavaea beijingensis]
MYLKRLEIIGFKSFGERIGLDFVPGVTAVVGPNGSGKSNITDAIRWVLGEQSAKTLRGGKMEDVIFSGSDSRKALNFAEVTLILDNSDGRVPLDFSEISVTRRVFRSGDSEYQINRQDCRLRDIVDLFMDSGLGKEAFSVISQGRVDEILNSKPEDRRAIFEEAAGVLKYKQRRRKAEHKLFETEDNLNRVLDILHELDGRLEPLRIQASAAKDYLAMSGELDEIGAALLSYDIRENEKQLADVRKQLEEATGLEHAAAEEAGRHESELGRLRAEAEKLAATLDGLHNALAEAGANVEKWEGRKQVLAERKTHAERQLERLRDDLAETEQTAGRLRQRKEQAEREATIRKKALREARSEIRRLQEVMDRPLDETARRIDELKSAYIELLNEEAAVKNELKHLTQQLEYQSESAQRNRARAGEARAEWEEASAALAGAEQELAGMKERLSSVRSDEAELAASRERTAAELNGKQEQLYKAYSLLEKLKGRREALLSMEAEFAGFHTGVREVLRAAESNRLDGIEGAVASLVAVKKEFAGAAETALGAAAQNIVTITEADARQAIGYLKKSRKGRATFLPLSVMKPRRVDPSSLSRASSHEDFIGTGDTVVTAEEKYMPIVQNLLGNVLISRTLKGANEIGKMIGHRYRVVTLDGDVVNAGGSMTGGGVDRGNPIFMRKAELGQVTADAVRLEKSIGNAEKVIASLKQQLTAQSENLDRVREEREALTEKEVAIVGRVAELKAAERRLADRLAMFGDEESGTTVLTTGIRDRIREAESRQAALKEELGRASGEIEEMTGLYEEGRTERDRMNNRLGDLKQESAVLAEQLAQAEAASAAVEEELAALLAREERLREEMEWTAGGDAGSSPEEAENELQTWKEKKASLEKELSLTLSLRESLQQDIASAEARFRRAAEKKAVHSTTVREAELRAGRITYELGSLRSSLEEDYGIDELPDAGIGFPENLAPEEARKKVRLLKQSIEELGPVNTASIEEFDAVSERHAFLTDQRNDLLEAKETLESAIDEMDTEVTERFSSTFHAVSRQFGIVFKELFGGGRTELVLTNPEDMLRTGIDIVACPPGKKLQNLSLLSGGERALTAIALLFAILKVRPVPFCVLDEVEAALDEANVLRYSDYLKKFSSETQFIVITHRKGTMEGADVLYGITMQESGISKPVSVRLTESSEVEYEEPVPSVGAGPKGAGI